MKAIAQTYLYRLPVNTFELNFFKSIGIATEVSKIALKEIKGISEDKAFCVSVLPDLIDLAAAAMMLKFVIICFDNYVKKAGTFY
jgi:hypothetical protein